MPDAPLRAGDAPPQIVPQYLQELLTAVRWYLASADHEAIGMVRSIGRSLAADIGRDMMYEAMDVLWQAELEAEASAVEELWVGICGWEKDEFFLQRLVS